MYSVIGIKNREQGILSVDQLRVPTCILFKKRLSTAMIMEERTVWPSFLGIRLRLTGTSARGGPLTSSKSFRLTSFVKPGSYE